MEAGLAEGSVGSSHHTTPPSDFLAWLVCALVGKGGDLVVFEWVEVDM